jgi:transitional endoplasmic reticulum ATPase
MVATKRVESGNVLVKREGDQIVLPVGMSYDQAILWMSRKKEEDEKVVGVHAELNNSYPVDGWVAFHKAIKEIYGWTDLRPTPGFFGDTPPAMISVPISATETAEFPWGKITFPGLDGALGTGFGWNPPQFIINGQIKQKNVAQFHRIVEKTKQILKTDSLYRGKAVRISYKWARDDREADRPPGASFNAITCAPKFMELGNLADDTLIFSADVEKAIRIGLFTPIERAAQCRKYGVPLKRGVLLQGPYGCGKTLTALVTARKAAANGWTFIYLDSVLDLEEGLKFAAHYSPCVLFVEDIDKALAQRQIEQDALLNLLDGIDTKNTELLTVFTTNFVDRLDPAFCRPGRLDDIIRVSPPDAAAAEKLARHYGRGLVAADADWTQIGLALDGKIPAVIREVVERAKMSAIARMGNDIVELAGAVTHEDILSAANMMEEHLRLINRVKPTDNRVYELTLKPESFTEKGQPVGYTAGALAGIQGLGDEDEEDSE